MGTWYQWEEIKVRDKQKDKKIEAKFKENWTDNAIDILEIKYDDYYIEYSNNKRGRPSKNKTPKKIKRLKESKKAKLIKTASTYDTSDGEEETWKYTFCLLTLVIELNL